MDYERSIAEGREPAVGYQDALKALELAIAAREAAAAGGPQFISFEDSNG